MEYDVDINEVHQKSTEKENDYTSRKEVLELELNKKKSKAEHSVEETQLLSVREKVEIGKNSDQIKARYAEGFAAAEQGLRGTRDLVKRKEYMNCIAELKSTMLDEIEHTTASIKAEFEGATLEVMKQQLEAKQSLRKLEQKILELSQKIQNEKRLKARIQAFSTLLSMIMQRVHSLVTQYGGAVLLHAQDQVKRLRTGESVNPLKENWLGGVYHNLRKRFATSHAGRFIKELVKLFSRSPMPFHNALAEINHTSNSWRNQNLWDTYMNQSTFFAVLLIHSTVNGQTKNNAIQVMDRWLSGLEKALAENRTKEEYEEENKDLLERLRDFASTTEREEASGAQYDQKQSQSQKAGTSSGTSSNLDTMRTDFESLSKKQQKKYLENITGASKAQVTALIAKTGNEQPGKQASGGGSSGKTEVPVGPDTITFNGTTYYRAPAPMKFKYVNKKLTSFFERPVKLSEDYITLNNADPSGQFKQEAVPYSATEAADPSVPAHLKDKKCESCGLWGHTKGRCLQKRK
jgi:hypothetical protein